MVEQSIHEVDFCGQVASAANMLFRDLAASDPAFPFGEARVEGFGTGAARRKRKDLRFFERGGKLALCGEVKLPGTPEGRSPYDDADQWRAALNNMAKTLAYVWANRLNVRTITPTGRRGQLCPKQNRSATQSAHTPITGTRQISQIVPFEQLRIAS